MDDLKLHPILVGLGGELLIPSRLGTLVNHGVHVVTTANDFVNDTAIHVMISSPVTVTTKPLVVVNTEPATVLTYGELKNITSYGRTTFDSTKLYTFKRYPSITIDNISGIVYNGDIRDYVTNDFESIKSAGLKYDFSKSNIKLYHRLRYIYKK